jgi:hypothetical protein
MYRGLGGLYSREWQKGQYPSGDVLSLRDRFSINPQEVVAKQRESVGSAKFDDYSEGS